ncbi:MAG: hypothetical protein HC893_16575 [Chloroflexaceae bacterium]|nr:hypothetical protein [Chloroflexaceae bacterium]
MATGSPPPASSGLLLIAHGSPDPAANQPIEAVAQRIRERCLYQEVRVGFLGLNAPDIPTAIRLLCERGVRQVIAVPYLLQLGGHVAEDLPQSITTAQIQHAPIPILLSEHLAYDPLLVTVIADRAKESVSSSA